MKWRDEVGVDRSNGSSVAAFGETRPSDFKEEELMQRAWEGESGSLFWLSWSLRVRCKRHCKWEEWFCGVQESKSNLALPSCLRKGLGGASHKHTNSDSHWLNLYSHGKWLKLTGAGCNHESHRKHKTHKTKSSSQSSSPFASGLPSCQPQNILRSYI